MAETLGGVNLLATAGQGAFEGEIDYVRPTRWAVAEPLGYTGRINTAVGVGPRMITLRRFLTSTTYTAIKTLADAAAAAGTTHAYVYTEGDMGITSLTVLIKEFRARKNRAVRGVTRWDCTLVLEEVV